MNEVVVEEVKKKWIELTRNLLPYIATSGHPGDSHILLGHSPTSNLIAEVVSPTCFVLKLS